MPKPNKYLKEDNIMNIGVYGRKSVFSDSSDSIQNQIRMCKEHIQRQHPNENLNFHVYSDEDFTGANVKRPDLERLVKDIKNRLLNIVVVYQLDRLSRSVRDFANLYETFETFDVKFISVKDQIDTTTPIGRASMYMSAVFAQMERENIATRVDDNMIGLAKMGLWFGGNPPTGYERAKITLNGRKHTTIVPVPEQVQYVNNIFDTFLSLKCSLTGMESYYKNNNILTLNGNFFSTTQIYSFLTSPVGVSNTPEIFDFYAAKGCRMDELSPRERYDGKHGLIVYGRTTEKKGVHSKQPPEKWRISIGLHEPIVAAEKWLKAQEQFGKNIFCKECKYEPPLLKGVLYCKCGRKMNIGRKKYKSGVSSSYRCPKRYKLNNKYCDMHQIPCATLDKEVIDLFNQIVMNPNTIDKFIDASPERDLNSRTEGVIGKQIQQTERKIKNLTTQLSLNQSSVAGKHIIKEIEILDGILQTLNKELSKSTLSLHNAQNVEKERATKKSKIIHLLKDFNNFSKTEQNLIVNEVIEKCVWDGELLDITM